MDRGALSSGLRLRSVAATRNGVAMSTNAAMRLEAEAGPELPGRPALRDARTRIREYDPPPRHARTSGAKAGTNTVLFIARPQAEGRGRNQGGALSSGLRLRSIAATRNGIAMSTNAAMRLEAEAGPELPGRPRPSRRAHAHSGIQNHHLGTRAPQGEGGTNTVLLRPASR